MYIADSDGNSIEKRYKYIGIATNNVAEYTAILLGITRAIDLEATDIQVYADSKLAVEQLSGNYKIKHPDLRLIYDDIQRLLSSWGGSIVYTHIPREQNKEADRLSNIAMDQAKKTR